MIPQMIINVRDRQVERHPPVERLGVYFGLGTVEGCSPSTTSAPPRTRVRVTRAVTVASSRCNLAGDGGGAWWNLARAGGVLNQLPEHAGIHVLELFNMQATLASLVFTESSED